MANKDHKGKVKASGSKNVLPIVAVTVVAVCAAVVFFTNRNKPDDGQTAGITGDTLAVEQQKAEKTGGASGDVSLVIAQGESLVIPVPEITGEASFFPITVDGEAMEVLAVRATDGSIRTAFNTCQSCFTSGAGFYRFENGELVCGNCGFHFSPDQVEITSGGCNPWPIFSENKTVTDDQISISYDFLAASKEIFANWKTAVH